MSTSGECLDIDECQNSPCDTYGICENSLGTFSCKCTDGYDGDGYTCNDINECDKSDTCDARATCVNHDGTFSCQCDSGFQSRFTFSKIKRVILLEIFCKFSIRIEINKGYESYHIIYYMEFITGRISLHTKKAVF